MTNFAETSTEFSQLDQRLNKVFKAYQAIRSTSRILAIAFGASLFAMAIPVVGMILLSLGYAAVPGVFVCYFVALAYVVKHGRIMKEYTLALESSGDEPTGMYLRGQAGYKQAKRKAIQLGLAVVSPIVVLALLVALIVATHMHH